MRVFLSWSGPLSKQVASALHDWLNFVFQDISPWMSERDISVGGRWGAELGTELATSNFGILCLTQENLGSPWLIFEAGSLAKDLSTARVVPYRFLVQPNDIVSPLSQFQGVGADEAGTLKLCEGINAVRETPLPRERLSAVFSKWWPDLRNTLENIDTARLVGELEAQSDRALLEQILSATKQVQAQTSPNLMTQHEETIRRVFNVIERLRDMTEETLEASINSAEDAWYKADRAEAWFFAEVANAWKAAGLSKRKLP